jgi:hypothetical protein
MWTVIRLVLHGEDARAYRTAGDLLRGAGFADPAAAEPGPGRRVVADLLQDPAVVARAVFEALAEAGLRPVWVSGSQVDVRLGRARRGAAAPRS